MSLREQFPDFDPAHSASSRPVVAVDRAANTDDEALHLTPTPSSSIASAHQTPISVPPAQAPGLSTLITAITANAGPSIAVLSGAIGLSAVLEDPSSFPRLSELGNGLIGLACAGGIVLGVVALDSATEGVGADVEEAWGRVWRWVTYRVGEDEEGEGSEPEFEETRMFDEEGGSVFLADGPPAATLMPPVQTSPTSQKNNDRPLLPPFTFPLPFDTRSEDAHTSPRQVSSYPSGSAQTPPEQVVPRHLADYTATSPLSPQTYADANHASGLLGPSPMPPRRSVEPAWTNFTGQGFHRHEQKLKAVGMWATPGRRDRTFDEALKEVEEMDDAGR